MDAIDFDELPTGVVLLNRSGDILHVNRHLKTMLEAPPEKDLRTKALKHLHPDYRHDIHDLFAALASGEIPRVECCIRLITAKHKTIWALLSARVYEQKSSPRKTLLAILHDMSLEREMLDEIETLNCNFDKISDTA